MSLVLGALFVGATVTQARVQLFNRDAIVEKSGKFEIEIPERARRGTIRSSDGIILAQSRDAYAFGINYLKCPKSPAFFLALGQASGFSQAELMNPALSGVKSRYWNEPVGADKYDAIRKVQKEWRADGLSLDPILKRAYPLAEDASGLVGAMRGFDAVTGLERSLNKRLSGEDGSAKGYYDRTGLFMPLDPDQVKDGVNGSDVRLTIDSSLQIEASRSLREMVERSQADSGAAIVMEPSTGRILAMANWPSYDPSGPITVGTDLNATYMRRLAPGSTFKALILALALQEGAISRDAVMQCNNALTVGGHTIRCSHGAHGQVDLGMCISKSCNIAAAQWAMAVGKPRFQKFLADLGLLEKPDLGLPHEIRGAYNTKDPAERLQLANNGFGQALDVTPVNLCSAFAALGNNGIKMRPVLIEKLGDQEFKPVAEGQVFDADEANFVKGLMVDTIEKDYGTAKKLRIPGYTIAGKTGTAQILKNGGEHGHIANFVGYVPAEKPKAVILVMVENPTAGSYYGGDVAGPVFEDIAKGVIRRYGIEPDKKR